MTQSKNIVCNFASLTSNSCVAFKTLSVALFVLLLAAPAAVGQVDRDDRESNFRSIDFPYQAIVRSESTAVYSGPDEVHYATDELPAGEVVVVYRHDPNGWCAIQPPAGSFSLLPEAAVDKVSDGLGILVQDQVQAWVGTRLGSVDKPLWQVKLRADEEVEIVGEASWPSPDGHSTIWYQISPPAGEFRWVKLADLQVPHAASRGLPEDRNLIVDQRQARNAFTEVDVDDDTYVQQAASFGNRRSTQEYRSRDQYKPKPQPDAGFVYRSEDTNPAADPYAAPKPPKLGNEAKQPKRDDSKIDFHFRPIGKTARKKTEGLSYNADKNVIASAELPRLQHAETKIDRLNREQDGVVQATYQSDPQPRLASAGQWRAASKEISSNARLALGGSNPKSPDSLLTRAAPTKRVDQSVSTQHLAPWETKRGNTTELRTKDSMAFQWDEQEVMPTARDFGSTTKDFGSAPQHFGTAPRNFDSAAIHFDEAAEEGVVISPMFSKLSPQLSKLEMELTNEMLKRPNEWQLSDLQLSVEQIYAQTRKPVERLQAQRILDKLKNCQKIRSGYAKSFQASGETFGTSLSPSLRPGPDGVGGLAAARKRLDRVGQAQQYGTTTTFGSGSRLDSGSTLGSSSRRSSGSTFGSSTRDAGGLVGTGIDTTVEAGALYDAHGWLTELVSEDRNNRPVYVLVNDDGKITHHIAASPGLNLHRYLKSKVGVNGRQGYNNVLKLSHVTADAVSELIRR